MAGGEPRLGTTATYMRHNDHGTTRLSTEIDILHDLINDEYRVFSAGSVRKWSKFGLGLVQCDRPLHCRTIPSTAEVDPRSMINRLRFCGNWKEDLLCCPADDLRRSGIESATDETASERDDFNKI